MNPRHTLIGQECRSAPVPVWTWWRKENVSLQVIQSCRAACMQSLCWLHYGDRVFHSRRNLNYSSICKLWWHQNNKTDDLFLAFIWYEALREQPKQQMLKVSTPTSRTSTHPKFCYRSMYYCLVRYLLDNMHNAKCFTNSSNFDEKQCLRMNACSAREYTMFALAHLLRNWHGQRPSSKDGGDLSVTGGVWRVYYMGMDLLLIYFLCSSVPILMSLGYVLISK
jgi:hypothetical protein